METRRPGRPRSFDEKAVLEKATQAFLLHGYESVSVEKIGAAMGLSKPSIYGAFGDKAALYERVAEDYAAEAAAEITRQLSGKRSLHVAATSCLLQAARVYARSDDRPLGCLLLGTAMPVSAQNERIRKIVSRFLSDMDDACERIVSREYARDAKRLGASPRRLSLQLSASLHTLAARARAGAPFAQLAEIAEELAAAFD